MWRINADRHPRLLQALHIYGIPTLVVFRGGQEFTRRTGAPSPDELAVLFEAALNGEPPVRRGLALGERLLRLFAGLAILALAYSGHFSGLYLALAGLGGVILFSAVHDRCPLWRTITSHLGQSRT